MRFQRRKFWILAVPLALLAVPIASKAAAFQGGYGRGMGEGGRRAPMSTDEELKRMTKDLNLTADEQSKIKPILEDQRKKMEDVRNDSSIDRPTMRQKMMQIHQDANEQIRAQLDDKQKDLFDKQEQQREDRMQNRRGGSGGAAGPEGDHSGGNPPPQN